MSASLVGSEMCIRDRTRTGNRPKAPESACQEQLAALLAPGRACENPVSYTHLTLPTICSV
eukprot:8566754-Alexandrium_andersonii.AAC.1